MVNGKLYWTSQGAFTPHATFTHLLTHSYSMSESIYATQCFLLQVHIHTPMDAWVGNMGFSVLPKDASAWKLGVEPPTLVGNYSSS